MSIHLWMTRRSKRWDHLQRVPLSTVAVLLLAVFFIFSVIGFFIDLMDGAATPYAVVLANAALSGLESVLWVLVLARLPMVCAFVLAVLEFFSNRVHNGVEAWVSSTLHPAPVTQQAGIHFAAVSILAAVLTSYACFVIYIRIAGKEAFRLQTELDLAHSIQKTLVPIIATRARSSEIYGVSEPSEKVGGDLVDVVELAGGDTIAYLADVAGHGLQAGILMGMLKTAARTALLDGGSSELGGTLSILMDRLNQVLPGVKEPHMYATFTALRLDRDGRSFYGMAASPPLLLWSAHHRRVSRIEQEQFPLALLPVSLFPAHAFAMEPGDLALVATDGILEVCSKDGTEFGAHALEALLMAEAENPLSELATSILKAVRAYGKQFDDQTLLLVRRHSF